MQTNPNSKRAKDQSSILYQNIVDYIDVELKLSNLKTKLSMFQLT